MAQSRYSKSAVALTVLLFVFIFSGCIRLQGKAGYWHQGSDEKGPAAKQVGFDTAEIIQRDRQEGNIAT